MLTQNQIEKILQAIDESDRMLNKELSYMPAHHDLHKIIALRFHITTLMKKIKDNAAETYLKDVR